jgi:hypothetical protein
LEIIINRLTNIENLLEIQGKRQKKLYEELIGRLEACELLKINSTSLVAERDVLMYINFAKKVIMHNELLDSIIKEVKI